MLNSIIRQLETINAFTGKAVSWLTLLMVLVTFLVVILRYAFDFGSIALQESITYMHAVVFLFGAAYTLQKNAHVRVDILYQRFSEKTRALIDLFGTLLFLAPTMLFIFIISWEYVAESWAVTEGSREAGGLPGVYLLKTSILVMAVLMLIQGLVIILRSLQTLQNKEAV